MSSKEKYLNKIIEEKNKSLRNIKYMFTVTMLLIFSILLIFLNIGKDVNESEFCLNKLNEHFPEYKFESASLICVGNDCSILGCEGVYEVTKVNQRDGLREVLNKETKQFELINEYDINYVNSDSWPNFYVGSGMVIILICLFICIFWYDKFLI